MEDNNNNNNINNEEEEEEEGSCSSRAFSLSLGSTTSGNNNNNNRKKRKQKVEVYEQVRRRLKELGNPEADQPGFDDELWAHFNRLSVRYALDVNVERAEDVLVHKKLLHTAHDPNTRIAFTLRLLQVHPICDENSGDFLHSNFTEKGDPQTSDYVVRHSIHPPPAFVLSPSLDLALEARISQFPEGSSSTNPNLHSSRKSERSLHEITISTLDKPKLLSQLTSLLSGIGLNIQEAHAFSTVDGYSLDVFIVDGWKYEETERLRSVLENEIPNIERKTRLENYIYGDSGNSRIMVMPDQVNIPMDGTDVWEIDSKLLVFEHKIASGSFGDLYKGTLHSQDVAIKCLKAHYLNAGVQKEFAQEIYILRKVRHKNVVQFIGACTRPPNLYIVTEFMAGGSVYDFLHKQKGFFKLPAILKVAIDVSKGMNYLHQNNIIHRDLKAANILMDDNEVVKVADFGVARVQTQSGVMTAETGTYRWMAPEVIEHRPYDHKADVFSFGIVLWELLTGKLPYEDVTPLQAAVGVVQKGLRPSIPRDTHPKIVELLVRCWQQDPSVRPDFSEIILILENIAQTVVEEERPGKRRNRVQREMN